MFHEYDYEIPLAEICITFVHSQNGLGKTTIMKLAYNVLSGNLEEVRIVPFDRLDLDFDDGTSIIVENRDQELTVKTSKAEIVEEIGPDELVTFADVVYIDPERIYTMDDDGHIVPTLPIYMNELSERIRAAKADSVLHEVEDDGVERTDAELDAWFKDLEAKVIFIRQTGFGPEIPVGLRFPPRRFEIGQYRDEYRKLGLSLQDYVDRYYGFAEDLVIFKDIINTVYVNKSVGLNEAGYIEARMDRSNTSIPVKRFSSGEKQILIMFYIILFRTHEGSIVIVDEPEVSLHVSWQQQIGRFIKDVCKIRGFQAIIATHAPSIIHDDWDLATELVGKRV